MKEQKKRSVHLSSLLIFIPFAFILFASGIPLIDTVMKSFISWNGVDSWNFVGFQNYSSLLHSEEFWIMLLNSIIILLYIPITVMLGLAVSILIYEEKKGDIFVFFIYIPQILSSVVAGKVFQFIFSVNGPINKLFRLFGCKQILFFDQRWSGFFVIILCLVWMDF